MPPMSPKQEEILQAYLYCVFQCLVIVDLLTVLYSAHFYIISYYFLKIPHSICAFHLGVGDVMVR